MTKKDEEVMPDLSDFVLPKKEKAGMKLNQEMHDQGRQAAVEIAEPKEMK